MSDSKDRTEEFITLLGKHSHEIRLAIQRLVLNSNEADDIFQETNLILWREFDRFEQGTNFSSWAFRIAVNQVLTWRKKKQRNRLIFGCEFIEEIAKDMDPSRFVLEERKRALAGCLTQLPKHQQKLIASRYADQIKVEVIADQQKRSTNAVYRALQRIRQALFACIEKKLKQQDDQKDVRSETVDKFM